TAAPKCTLLGLLARTRDLKGCFYPGIEISSCYIASEVKRFGQGRIRQNKNRNKRIIARHKEGFAKISRFVVVGCAEPGTRDDAEPAKIRVWVKELVKSIDPPTFVVFKPGAARESAMKVRNPGFALVKDR